MTDQAAALDLIGWLDRAKDPIGNGVRERYKLSAHSWVDVIRPDCNSEAAYAYLLAWQATNTETYLTRSRDMWPAYSGFQNLDGSWIFGSYNSGIWTNNDSEIIIFLLRAAALDPVMAATYRAAALATSDHLVTIQHESGHWPGGNYANYRAAMFTCHAVAGLVAAYPLAGAGQAAYLAAIETGLAATGAAIGEDGRVQTGYDVVHEESWRPPSSDQAICVRAYAMAEQAFPGHPDASTWRAHRHALLGWLDGLIHPSGAVRNGYGVGASLADVWHVTDHVYTTQFAIEAYRRSAVLDRSPRYAATAEAIVAFTVGNIWYDETDPDADGCLRGAYDLTAQDFDTSEIPQNGGEEGGGDMAYTGWSAAPVAALLFEGPPTITPSRRGAAAGVFL